MHGKLEEGALCVRERQAEIAEITVAATATANAAFPTAGEKLAKGNRKKGGSKRI